MKLITTMTVFILAVTTLALSADGQDTRVELSQAVAQLQKTPTDNAMREKIIKLGGEMKPAPTIPEEAERRMARGTAAFKGAKSTADYQDAIKEFEAAVAAAPWYGDAYFNLGVAQDKAEKYGDALQSLKWALMSSPDSKDIKALMYEVEFRKEKAEKAKAQAEAAANSPQGRAQAMLAILRKQYGGPAMRLLICGTRLNEYWHCTDAEARGKNWLDSTLVDSAPKWAPNPIAYKIDGKASDLVRIELGSTFWPNSTIPSSPGWIACGKPNGDDPNNMNWYRCPDFSDPNQLMDDVRVVFSTTSDGQPMIEYRQACGGKLGADSCRRNQFILRAGQ